MLPASRRAFLGPAAPRGAVFAVRRRLTTAAEDISKSTEASSNPPPPKKRRGFVRTTLLYTTVFGATFYAGSTLIALHESRYRDFFIESVPFGEGIMDYAEAQRWDEVPPTTLPKKALDTTKGVYRSLAGAVTRTFGSSAGIQSPSPPDSVQEVARVMTDKTKKGLSSGVTFIQKKVEGTEVVEEVKTKVLQFPEDVQRLVEEAEKALAGVTPSKPSEPVRSPLEDKSSSVEPAETSAAPPQSDKAVYTATLPLGFEPPPGYARPSPPKSIGDTKTSPIPPLPLVAPAVKELSASEPVIAQIASTIDGLAILLKDSPASSADAKDILDTAQNDLVKLGTRIDAIKREEKGKLEDQLEEQAKDYSAKILQLEIDAQDKIDAQEEGFKAMLEDERQKILDLYRQKLAHELETQNEIINQRLKEEVIAQGIEMQRRWIREIKVRVEQERGGRLSKLADLATGVKKLERVTLDNSSYLDENVRLHTLWSALRALASALDSPVRRPFREELRVISHVAAARDDPLIMAALDSIEQTDIPDTGVEPIGDLVAWFTESVGPRVEAVALVPDQNTGVLSHLASSALSALRFKRQGLVEGEDVLSVVARAEHYLAEKDLDNAARELNQLKGVPKVLLSDWLSATRKRLEVEQALEVIQSQATLSSLLVV